MIPIRNFSESVSPGYKQYYLSKKDWLDKEVAKIKQQAMQIPDLKNRDVYFKRAMADLNNELIKGYKISEDLARKVHSEYTHEDISILINPDLGEINRIAGMKRIIELRGIIDKKGNLYVADAQGVSHYDIEHTFNIDDPIRLIMEYNETEITSLTIWEPNASMYRDKVFKNPNVLRIANSSTFRYK